MNREFINLSRRFSTLLDTVSELESDLIAQLEKESRQLEAMEQGARFKAGEAERQGRVVRVLELSLANVEKTLGLVDDSVDQFEELLESR
jgi:hypothetical protein